MTQEKPTNVIDLSASRAATGADGVGPFLASARMAAGLDIADAANATNIKVSHLEAIEAGDPDRMPPMVYAIGFVKAYASYLGLDGDLIAEDFRAEMPAVAAPLSNVGGDDAPMDFQSNSTVKVGSFFGILLIIGFAVWIGVQVAGNGDEALTNNDGAQMVRLSETRAEPPRPRPATEVTTTVELPVREEEEAPAPSHEEIVGTERVTAPAQEAPAKPIANDNVEGPAQTPEPIAEEEVAQPETAPVPAPEPVIIDARLIRSIGPLYPARCEEDAQGLETVTVMFDVNVNGRTANPRVTRSSDSCFNEAAVAAIEQWRFNPRTVDGAPRPQRNVEATLNFRQ